MPPNSQAAFNQDSLMNSVFPSIPTPPTSVSLKNGIILPQNLPG